MATKSIMKNIDIRDKNLGKNLITALENASGKHGKNVQISRSYSEAKGEQIKKIFCNNK